MSPTQTPRSEPPSADEPEITALMPLRPRDKTVQVDRPDSTNCLVTATLGHRIVGRPVVRRGPDPRMLVLLDALREPCA